MALTYSDIVKNLGPVAYWRMGEASGNFADSSGNGNTATVSGSTWTYAQTGAIANDPNLAARANAGSMIGTTTITPAGAFSLVAWTNPTNGGASGAGRIFDASKVELFGAGVGSTNLNFRLNGTTIAGQSNNSWTYGAYHLVVATYDGSNSGTNNMALYVDNVLVANASAATLANATALTLGNEVDTLRGFNGSLDEMAYFNKVLTLGQIGTLYLAGVGAATTVYGGNYPAGIKPVLFVTPSNAGANAPAGVRKVINADTFSGPNFPADVLPVSLSTPPQLYKCVAIAQPGDVATSFPPGVLPVLPVDATGTPV